MSNSTCHEKDTFPEPNSPGPASNCAPDKAVKTSSAPLSATIETGRRASVSYEPTLESTAYAAGFVEEQLLAFGAPYKQTMRLLVLFDEIYSNIVNYSGASLAVVSVIREGEFVRLEFEDNGIAFDPLAQEDPDVTAGFNDRTEGGLGIYMAKQMTDDISYQRKDERNILSMSLKLPTA